MQTETLNGPLVQHIEDSQREKSVVPFKAVYALVDLITALPNKDTPPASDYNGCIVKSLAEENGFQALRTPEEFAIFAAMKDLNVGPRTAHYGWRLYRRYRITGAFDSDVINY